MVVSAFGCLGAEDPPTSGASTQKVTRLPRLERVVKATCSALSSTKTQPAHQSTMESTKTVYDRVKEVFFEMDLDWEDVAERIDEDKSDDDRILTLLIWMDHSEYDEEWKDDIPTEALDMLNKYKDLNVL